MLLEHQAAMKLARKLAQKIGAEPEKFGEMARKAAQAPEGLACGLNYGPIPIGAAGKALNFMHWAVNGVRPYPEEGGGKSPKDNCSTFGDDCIESGGYNPSSCTRSSGFNGDEYCTNPGGAYAGVCISPNIYACTVEHPFVCNPPFKCNAPFGCTGNFGGCDATHKYCQCADLVCPNNQTRFTCSNFTCSAKDSSQFGCPVPGGATFTCVSTNSEFGCAVIFTCNEGPYVCSASKHDCTGEFECQTDDHYTCSSSFACHNDAVTCGEHFDCDTLFECLPWISFANTDCNDQNYDCWNVFTCDEEAYSPPE